MICGHVSHPRPSPRESTLFELLELQADADGWRCLIEVPPSSPYFEGHFPGQPVLPGVAQLEIVVDLLRRCLAEPERARAAEPTTVDVVGLRQVRFRELVQPGDRLDVRLARPDGDGECTFRMEARGKLAASGRVRLRGHA